MDGYRDSLENWGLCGVAVTDLDLFLCMTCVFGSFMSGKFFEDGVISNLMQEARSSLVLLYVLLEIVYSLGNSNFLLMIFLFFRNFVSFVKLFIVCCLVRGVG